MEIWKIFSSDSDKPQTLQAVLNDSASHIAQMLPDTKSRPDAVLYFLEALEVTASELDFDLQ